MTLSLSLKLKATDDVMKRSVILHESTDFSGFEQCWETFGIMQVQQLNNYILMLNELSLLVSRGLLSSREQLWLKSQHLHVDRSTNHREDDESEMLKAQEKDGKWTSTEDFFQDSTPL